MRPPFKIERRSPDMIDAYIQEMNQLYGKDLNENEEINLRKLIEDLLRDQ